MYAASKGYRPSAWAEREQHTLTGRGATSTRPASAIEQARASGREQEEQGERPAGASPRRRRQGACARRKEENRRADGLVGGQVTAEAWRLRDAATWQLASLRAAVLACGHRGPGHSQGIESAERRRPFAEGRG